MTAVAQTVQQAGWPIFQDHLAMKSKQMDAFPTIPSSIAARRPLAQTSQPPTKSDVGGLLSKLLHRL